MYHVAITVKGILAIKLSRDADLFPELLIYLISRRRKLKRWKQFSEWWRQFWVRFGTKGKGSLPVNYKVIFSFIVCLYSNLIPVCFFNSSCKTDFHGWPQNRHQLSVRAGSTIEFSLPGWWFQGRMLIPSNLGYSGIKLLS